MREYLEIAHEIKEYLEATYALWAFLIAVISAQAIKPLFHYLFNRTWTLKEIVASGGFPSSHTAAVTALTLSIGLREGFDSPIFAMGAAFSLIIAYDAANVRYYAGKNIELTQQLIKDVQELTKYKLDDPIYLTKIKQVLGHKWIEVIGGIIHGSIIAYLLFIL